MNVCMCMTLRNFVSLVILEDYEVVSYATGYSWLTCNAISHFKYFDYDVQTKDKYN